MKMLIYAALAFFVMCGCIQICEFGETPDSSGLKCFGLFPKAKVGMTQKEVEKKIGSPQRRKLDVEYRGQSYDEVWVYDNVSPPTVLYFKGGILEYKEYEDYYMKP